MNVKRSPAGSDSQSAFEVKECKKRERRANREGVILRLKYLGTQVRRRLPCEPQAGGAILVGALGSACSHVLLCDNEVGVVHAEWLIRWLDDCMYVV